MVFDIGGDIKIQAFSFRPWNAHFLRSYVLLNLDGVWTFCWSQVVGTFMVGRW